MQLYFSPDFYYFLRDSKSNNIIASFLYEYSAGYLDSDISHIKILPEDKASFLTEDSIIKLSNNHGMDIKTFIANNNTPKGLLYTDDKFRTEIKIGRLIRKIFERENIKSSYDNFLKYNYPQKASFDEILEKLTIEYKLRTKRIFDENFDSKLILVEGEDIRKYYNEENYINPANNKSSLHQSCMRFDKCESYLDLYVKNPDVCKLLIFKEESEKISGRALIWKLSNGKTYMDRSYTSLYSDIRIFTAYAEKNNWLCYDNNDFIDLKQEIIVDISNIDLPKYPYMDSLMFLSLEDKKIVADITYFQNNYTQKILRRLRSQEGKWSDFGV